MSDDRTPLQPGDRVIVTDPVDLKEHYGATTGAERDGLVTVKLDGRATKARFSVQFVRPGPVPTEDVTP